MLNNILKSISLAIILVLILSGAGTINAQDHPDTSTMHKEGMMHKSDNHKMHKSGDHKMMGKSDDHKMMDHEDMTDSSKMKMMKDHKDMNHKSMMDSDHKGMTDDNISIVREGAIDLSAIDENGDGKVFQDMMDWNVISDEPGKCPVCGMTLKEVTLEKAKANLEKNGIEVK